MPHILKYCLQMNSIACANERIPRRARKSAFLGIVHFAHCHTFLNSHSFLKHFISYFTRWQETQRVRRLFSNHYGVLFYTTIFYNIHLYILKPPLYTFADITDTIGTVSTIPNVPEIPFITSIPIEYIFTT